MNKIVAHGIIVFIWTTIIACFVSVFFLVHALITSKTGKSMGRIITNGIQLVDKKIQRELLGEKK